jgi:hypothetical protein
VSPSWRDRYFAALRPDRVDLLRVRRGFKPQADLGRSAPVAQDGEETPWIAALAAARRLLEGDGIGRGDLTVVISNHFVRYLIIPWDDQIGSIEEYESYARIAFENVFGEVSRGWSLRTSVERPGAPRLAAAIDGELARGLKQLGGDRLRLVSVQPYLMAAYNRLGAGFRRGDFFFLLVEPGRASVVSAVGGTWRAARNQTVAEEADIAAFVERELRLLETSDSRVPQIFMHAPGSGALRLPLVHGVAPHVLALPQFPGAQAEAAADYAMAMAAI